MVPTGSPLSLPSRYPSVSLQYAVPTGKLFRAISPYEMETKVHSGNITVEFSCHVEECETMTGKNSQNPHGMQVFLSGFRTFRIMLTA